MTIDEYFNKLKIDGGYSILVEDDITNELFFYNNGRDLNRSLEIDSKYKNSEIKMINLDSCVDHEKSHITIRVYI